MFVTFCGHSKGYNTTAISVALTAVVAELIDKGADKFYIGGYGDFDYLAACAVRDAKSIHAEIRSILVIPYMNREFDTLLYDGSVYPPLESVPLKFAISKRNKWMIDQADIVVSGVIHDWGGAATMLKYARLKKKCIISVVTKNNL